MTIQRKIILGVTGGVAAYKAADIARRLMDKGLAVQVVMTANAEAFITPLTFEALTGLPVLRSVMPSPGEEPIPHIALPREAEMILVAPATANIIGKLAGGVADDTLSTLLLASGLPTVIAPAMNTKMYENAAVQENIEKLKKRGIRFIGPAAGLLACGDEGAGKLADVDDITAAVSETLALRRDMEGVKILVTAGGTREPVDPVRFIGNRSSGKMGLAIAEAAFRRGADVTLVAAAMETQTPKEIKTIRVQTAEEMLREVDSRFDDTNVLIMTAAVGDYRVLKTAGRKVKKGERRTIALTENPDILARMGERKRGQTLVGFAAETDNVVEYGKEKLISKNLDMIVANDVSRDDIGFGSDYNEVAVITRGGDVARIPRARKSEIADNVLDKVMEILKSKRKPENNAEQAI